LKHGDGFLLVFDLSNRETFESVKNHRDNVLRVKAEDPNLPIILIGNKSDLQSQRKISQEEAVALAQKWNIEYIETSAKTRENVDKAFSEIFVKIKNIKQLRRANPTQFPTPPAARMTKDEEKAVREDSTRKRVKKFYQNFRKKCTIS
jgi:GTPase SAR1 family protein